MSTPTSVLKWGLLLHPSLRARAYLQILMCQGFFPDEIFVLGEPEEDRCLAGATTYDDFDPNESLRCTLAFQGLDWVNLSGSDVRSPDLVQAIGEAELDLCIFSGGGILPPAALDAAGRWIHVHPGRLPQWRGSTCHYYGLLLEGIVEVTAFYMEAGLDRGEVICSRQFTPDSTWRVEDLDACLDARLRALVLADAMHRILLEGLQRGREQAEEDSQMFYVIHPVLKQLAVASLDSSTRPEWSPAPPTEEVAPCPSS